MFKVVKYLFAIIIAVFIIIIIIYQRGINNPVASSGADKLFIINTGQSIRQIGENLEQAGLIKKEIYFTLYLKLNKEEDKIQAGEYILNPASNTRQIANVLVRGESLSKEKDITIIEGWTINDIAQYFKNQGMFNEEEIYKTIGYPKVDYRIEPDLPKIKDYSNEYDFLADKPKYYSLEGYLFPDTYRIYEDATIEGIVAKMLDNFNLKLSDEMRQEIKKQNKTIYQIVTMASLIEKEVRSYEDMRVVSGIFWDRIEYGQALESCASLAYILGINKARYSAEDTKINSPYNTYKNQGLPPGPICNPGINAIKAAIYPQHTEFNYFLSKPDTGETVFSRTYQEHINNKAKYLK